MCGTDIFLALLAILFPPVAVWVKRGICSADSVINLALCCLGLLPGLLHAWYIIYTHPDPGPEYERVPGSDEEGTVTYYYVQRGAPPPGARPVRVSPHPQAQNKQYRSQPRPTYGGVAPMPGSASQQQFPGQQSGSVNAFAGAPNAPHGKGVPQHGDQAADNGEGSAAPPPPTYAEAVKGDHKIQT